MCFLCNVDVVRMYHILYSVMCAYITHLVFIKVSYGDTYSRGVCQGFMYLQYLSQNIMFANWIDKVYSMHFLHVHYFMARRSF